MAVNISSPHWLTKDLACCLRELVGRQAEVSTSWCPLLKCCFTEQRTRLYLCRDWSDGNICVFEFSIWFVSHVCWYSPACSWYAGWAVGDLCIIVIIPPSRAVCSDQNMFNDKWNPWQTSLSEFASLEQQTIKQDRIMIMRLLMLQLKCRIINMVQIWTLA